MVHKMLVMLIVFSIGLSGCSLPGTTEQAISNQGGAKVWFDAPLPNSEVVLPNPVQLVMHGSDPNGISTFELSANGNVIAGIPSSSISDSLVTQTYEWEPPEPGNYLITVRAKNNAGMWSPYAETMVIVSTPEVVQTATPTVIPLLTETPTQVPVVVSPTPTIVPTQPATISVERVSSNLVYIGRSDCGPMDVTITSRATAPNGIKVVVLFYRFAADGASNNFESIGMNPIGDDLYQAVFNPSNLLGGSIPFDQATLQYQVIIQQNDGDTAIRTEMMSDITVEACGSVSSACSAYTDQRSCIANGCQWTLLPGTVPIYACENP